MARTWTIAVVLLVLSAQGEARPDCDALACAEVKQYCLRDEVAAATARMVEERVPEGEWGSGRG